MLLIVKTKQLNRRDTKKYILQIATLFVSTRHKSAGVKKPHATSLDHDSRLMYCY